MEPRFRKNSILIIDPNCDYLDGKFAVISLDNQTVTVRQLANDNTEIYFKHFDGTVPSVKYDKKNI